MFFAISVPADAMTGRHRHSAPDLRHLWSDLSRGQHEASVGVVDRRAERHSQRLAVEVDQRPTGSTLPHSASDRVHLTRHRGGGIDVRVVEFDDLAVAGGSGLIAATWRPGPRPGGSLVAR